MRTKTMHNTTDRRGITVEAQLESELERVWALTQTPARHSRWDLRFGRIDPVGEGAFRYRRFGVAGTGEHSGERRSDDGEATSALRFACSNRLSPIEEGSGYWRYVPRDGGGVTFLTWFDYRSRYPRLDRLFRPVMACGAPPGRSTGCGCGPIARCRPNSPPVSRSLMPPPGPPWSSEPPRSSTDRLHGLLSHCSWCWPRDYRRCRGRRRHVARPGTPGPPDDLDLRSRARFRLRQTAPSDAGALRRRSG